MKVLVLIVGCTVMAVVVYATFLIGLPTELGFEGAGALPWLNVALVAFLMLLGLMFGCLFRQITGRTGRVDVIAEVSIMLTSSSFLSGLCVSPFVFMSVYAVVKGSPGDPASLLLAFQNGFFCESVFSRLFAENNRVKESTKVRSRP